MKNLFYGVTYSSEEFEDFDLGVAFSPKEWNDRIIKGKRGQSFPVMTFPTLLLQDGGFADYQASNIGTLCSLKLKTVIEQYKSSNDSVEWFDVDIHSEEYGARRYYFMHFPSVFDVLDEENTVFTGSKRPVIPCFSYRLVKDHHIFAIPGSFTGFIVSNYMREKILEADCFGLAFYSIETV